MTGWNYPPGVTGNEPYLTGDEGPCECCGHDVTDCICPECPVCGSQGDQRCYIPEYPHIGEKMEYNREQRIGQTKMRIAMYREMIQDAEQFIAFMEEHPEEDHT